MRIANSGVLMRCWPRSPWYQASTRTMGRPMRSASSGDLADCGASGRIADVLEALQETPGGGDVYESPLDDLAAAQPGPGAFGFTLCRRCRHLEASVSSSGASFGRAARRARCCAMSRSMSAKTALNSGSLRIEASAGSKSRK